MNVLALIFFVLATITVDVKCIMFKLEPNAQKCLKEELQSNVLVSGDYEISEVPGQKVDYSVKDSKSHILSQKEDTSKGKFSFVTETFDTFEVCFGSRVPPNQRGIAHEVSLIIKRGVEAKSYAGALGEAAKLKPFEVELKRLEDLSDAIVQDFALMRKREEEMRDTNESTNSRVMYLSIFGMCCLLGLATWQLLYLRRYFKAKKLIE